MSKKYWMRALLFVVAVAVTLILLPRKTNRIMSFQEGRPWSHSLLTAPFDIPVYRDSATVRQMRDSLNAAFIPVYTKDDSGGKELLRELMRLRGVSPEERAGIRNAVISAYSKGIISSDELNKINREDLTEVRFVKDNEVVRRPTAGFRSPRQVYLHIDSLYPKANVRTALAQIDFGASLVPNIVMDTAMTRRIYEDNMRPIKSAVGVIQQGERIVDRGELVTPQLFTVLNTYQDMLQSRDFISNRGNLFLFIGQAVFAVILFGAVYIYLLLYRSEIFNDTKKIIAVISSILLIFIAASIAFRAIPSGIYLVPFAILPIMLTVFFDSRTSLFCHVVCVLLCSALATVPFEFIFLEITAGMVSIFSLRELTRRSQLLRTALFVFLTYEAGYVAAELLQAATITSAFGRMTGFFAINAVLITFAYLMIFVYEKIFGLISNVSLVELCDINNKLLSELSSKAPGTFQHCMNVSNLAADAAGKISANKLLVRTGALYHDIGKTKNPVFFTENQHNSNPHNGLTPRQSASIIISHVTDGLKLAENEKLPKIVKDMIAQHHGKGLVKYFYVTEKNNHPGEEIDPAPFTYPGPNPETREASLLMMADAVEAASHSLKEYTTEAISELVNRIIDNQIKEGLHNNSTLSFKDIQVIKDAFINRLRTIYHVRIAYPKEIRPENADPEKKQS